MRLSLGHKVFLTLFLSMAALAAVVLLVTGRNLGRGFSDYVARAETLRLEPMARLLADLYDPDQGWSAVPSEPGAFGPWLGARIRKAGPPRDLPGPPPGAEGPGRDGLSLGPRLALLDASGRRVAGSETAERSSSRVDLVKDGQRVGFLALSPLPGGANELDREFLAEQRRSLVLVGLAALAGSALAAFLLARHLRAPLRDLVEGTRRMAAGDFAFRIATDRTDELGDLARDFNVLAAALETNEQSRRQWVADTSHELRTPLAVLRAQIEALMDGVHPANPQTLGTLHGEVVRLTRLADDLHTLARSDAQALPVRPEGTDVEALVRDVAAPFADRCTAAGLDLQVEAEPQVFLEADPARLRQVLVNLLENSLRYTARGGAVRVSVAATGGDVVIAVEDSAPGVPPEALPRLFDRFFRVDGSRSREHGGSGLGLAICRSLVEAHGGTIGASPSSLGGLKVEVRVPREGRRRRVRG